MKGLCAGFKTALVNLRFSNFMDNQIFNKIIENNKIQVNVNNLTYGYHTVLVNYRGDINYTALVNLTNLGIVKNNIFQIIQKILIIKFLIK